MLVGPAEGSMTVDSSSPVALRPRSVFTVLIVLVAAAGVPGPFLAFVENVSALSVVMQALGGRGEIFNVADLVWIAAPFFLAPLVTLAHVRWAASGRLSAGERVAGWAAGTLAAASIAWFFWHELWPEADDQSIAQVGLFLLLSLLPAGGVCLAAWLRRRVPPALAPLVAVETAYVSNAGWCLWMFHESRYQAGAYCAAIAAAALLVHVVSVSAAGFRRGAS
jgi:hypothetical protein